MSKAAPLGWCFSNVGLVCDVLDSKRIPINSEERSTRKGRYPYYGANGVQGFIDDFIFEGEHILLAEDGGNFDQWESRPISYLVSGRFWVNNHAHILKAKNGNVNRFLHYSLVHRNITKHINGGTRAKLNQADMRDIELLLPPFLEQQKIASILTAVDDVIESTQAQINKLKNLKTGMMQELLTKGIGHTEFKDSPVGRIPKAWSFSSIGALAEQVKPGPFGSSITKSMYVVSGYKVYGQEQVIAGNLKVGNYYVTQEKYEELSAFQVRAGEILISLVGTFGQILIVPDNFEPGIINPRLLKLRMPKNKVHSGFITHQLRSEFVVDQLNRFQQGGTMGVLSGATLKPVMLVVPPLAEQEKISKLLSTLDENIFVKEAKKLKLVNHKKALMQDLLTGKVRVKVTPQ